MIVKRSRNKTVDLISEKVERLLSEGFTARASYQTAKAVCFGFWVPPFIYIAMQNFDYRLRRSPLSPCGIPSGDLLIASPLSTSNLSSMNCGGLKL